MFVVRPSDDEQLGLSPRSSGVSRCRATVSMRLSHVRSKLLAFAFLPLMACVLGGCGGSNSSSQQPSSLDKAVDGVVQNSMQSTGVPGVTVALAQNGAVMYAQGYGFSDLMTHPATQPNVIFEIGSITKQFSAAIIMKLQEMALLHVEQQRGCLKG